MHWNKFHTLCIGINSNTKVSVVATPLAHSIQIACDDRYAERRVSTLCDFLYTTCYKYLKCTCKNFKSFFEKVRSFLKKVKSFWGKLQVFFKKQQVFFGKGKIRVYTKGEETKWKLDGGNFPVNVFRKITNLSLILFLNILTDN